jgi:predicted RNA binding protein YcfA (HicA-like mRNA interferase family)
VKARKARDVRRALLKKGFREDAKRDHCYYFIYVDERRSGIYTKISHGEMEIGSGLLSVMARQLRIDNPQFERLVDCDLSGEEYVRLVAPV